VSGIASKGENGGLGWEAGWVEKRVSPLAHDKAVSRSGRNDGVGVVEEERHSGRYAPLGNAGILRCAQNDDVKRTTATATATAKAKATAKARAGARAKTKYRDLSTAAAKCAAFGRDDVCRGLGKEQAAAVEMTFVWVAQKENRQQQEQQQNQARRSYTFPPIAVKLRWMGHPYFVGWVEEEQATARQQRRRRQGAGNRGFEGVPRGVRGGVGRVSSGAFAWYT